MGAHRPYIQQDPILEHLVSRVDPMALVGPTVPADRMDLVVPMVQVVLTCQQYLVLVDQVSQVAQAAQAVLVCQAVWVVPVGSMVRVGPVVQAVLEGRAVLVGRMCRGRASGHAGRARGSGRAGWARGSSIVRSWRCGEWAAEQQF